MKIKKLNESGYKLTIKKDDKTFNDYCYDYRKESAVAQMKAKYGDDIEVLDVVEHNKLNEGIEVETIADYITDHYKFETIDDKYSCIDSIRDSFKNEKTISKEELEQFIGSHNGKDKLEESGISDVEPKFNLQGKSSHTFTKDKKWEVDFDEKGNILARTRHGKPSYFKGHINDKTNDFPSTDEDNIILAAREQHRLKFSDDELNEASYGGAFDIADNQIFTREDIDNLAEEVLNHINETYEYKFDISAAYIDGNELEVGVENDELGEYITTLKIDMKKVKEPWHLKRVYAFEVASDLINQISRSLNNVKELKESIKNIDARTLRNALTAIHKAEEVLNDLSLDVKQELYLDNILKELNNAKVEAKDIIEDNLNNEDKNVLFSEFELDDIHLITESDSKEIEDEIINESNTEDAEPIETGAAVGMATVLSDLIKDEYEAIDGYNAAIATAEVEGFSDMIKVLTDIQAEENIHIGQLQELMKIVDPNASKIEDGTVEAEELLSNPSVNDDDDFDFEDIDEGFDVSEDDIADEDVEAAIKAVEEAMKEPNKEDIDLTNANFELEDDDEVIVESTEPWEDIYNSFKDIEVQLNGDGEAITATIDRIYNDNKGNPDFEKAYKKWAANE